MAAETKLVYGLNSPEEFENARVKLETSDASDLLQKVAVVLPGTTFSSRGAPDKRWPEIRLESPRTSQKPDMLNSVYFTEDINLGSISISYATLVPDRICVEVNNGWISVGREGRGNASGASRDWQTDLPSNVGRHELAEAIFNGVQRMTNFDVIRTEQVQDALGLAIQKPQS